MPKKFWKKQQENQQEPEPERVDEPDLTDEEILEHGAVEGERTDEQYFPLEPNHTPAPFQRPPQPQYAASERGVLRGYKDSVRVRPGVIELHPDRTR